MKLLRKLPFEVLTDDTKVVGQLLDDNPFAQRGPGEARGNKAVEPSEVRFGVEHLDLLRLSPPQEQILFAMADVLGVEHTNVAKKWLDRNAPNKTWLRGGYLDAVALGNYVFLSQRGGGVLRYDVARDEWFRI